MTYHAITAFDPQHRCFREALVFFTHYAAMRELLPTPSEDDELRLAGAPESLNYTALLRISDILAFLRGGPQPETLSFAEGQSHPDLAGDDFGTQPEAGTRRQSLPPSGAGFVISHFLLGNAWERTAREVQATLPGTETRGRRQPLVKEWPPEFAFYFHLRNACFHRGRFSIRDIHQVKPSPTGNPANWPQWRNHVIDDFGAIKDRPVFGPNGLLSIAEVLPLLWEMGNALDRLLGPLPPG